MQSEAQDIEPTASFLRVPSVFHNAACRWLSRQYTLDVALKAGRVLVHLISAVRVMHKGGKCYMWQALRFKISLCCW